MLKEFKEFALKGNIIDLAIGVIIGGAFQSIVNSLVNDLIMPLINSITGKVDFSDLVFTIGNSSVRYGAFISAVVNFLIVAFTLFLVIKYINRLNRKIEEAKKQEASKVEELKKKSKLFNKYIKQDKGKETKEIIEEPSTKLCPYCLSEIPYKATRCSYCTSKLEDK